jgi:hypothetical protein
MFLPAQVHAGCGDEPDVGQRMWVWQQTEGSGTQLFESGEGRFSTVAQINKIQELRRVIEESGETFLTES